MEEDMKEDIAMLKKGDKTRQFIISESKKLFSKCGYNLVTMKDVCEACSLSRGGLYRYFGSTKEIFLEILNDDKEDKDQLLVKCMDQGMSAVQIFHGFLEDRKKTLIFGEYNGFSFAVQQFTKQELGQREFLQSRANQAKQSLIGMFEYGQSRGEFREFDKESMALAVLLFLDSLEINGYILELSEDEVCAQLELLCGAIIK